MSTTRRDFIRASAVAAGALGLAGLEAGFAEERRVPKAKKPLRLLILGGTTYLGPYQIRYALERGHQVTIFNRGKTKPTLFPEVFPRVEWLSLGNESHQRPHQEVDRFGR